MLFLKENAYYQLLRVDHWFKNLFIFFGLFTGVWYLKIDLSLQLFILGVIAFLLASFISAANYIINQIADKNFDLKHDSKKERPLPSKRISIKVALIIFVSLISLSLSLSFYFFSINFTKILISFIDVLSESINNPIRFLLGWFVIGGNFYPPIVFLLLTWIIGAILMTAKRYDELMFFGKKINLYRATFQKYSLKSLKLMLFLYSFLLIVCLMVIFYPDMKLFLSIPIILVYIIWLIKQIISGKAKTRSVEAFVLTKKFIIFSSTVVGLILLLVINKK